MKKNRGFWIFLLAVAAFAGGWMFAVVFNRQSLSDKFRTTHEAILNGSLRQIDSLEHMLSLDRELIVRLSGRLDSLQRGRTANLHASNTPKGGGTNHSTIKKNSKDVFLTSDAELEFFNTYIENETDINF